MAAGKNRIITNLVSVFVLVTTAPTFAGNIIFVDADAPGDGDGTSWVTAYNFLQDALADANSSSKPVEIRVAEGIYKPDQGAGITPGDRNATFQLINSVAIKGGYAGFGQPDPNQRDIELYETTLSGDLNADDIPIAIPEELWNEPTLAENSYHVVTGSGTDATAFLGGFTVCGGNAAIDYLMELGYKGAGMHNYSGSPTVTNCTFTLNSAWEGAAMYNYSGSPTVTNCTFTVNSSRWHDDGQGAGMYNSNASNPTVKNCTFSNNYTEFSGAGMSNESSSPTLVNCTFKNNVGGDFGSGMHNKDSAPILLQCVFLENRAHSGGAIRNRNSGPKLLSCLFVRNHADGTGGGMWNSGSSPVLIHCTFHQNSALHGRAISCDSWQQESPSTLQVTNCILWDGADEIWNSDGSTIEITYSDVEGGWPGDGNIDIDPLFVDVTGGNYHLLQDSPCIDAGVPNYMPEPNETDLDGNPRVIGGRIDMGAYEFQGPFKRYYYVDGVNGSDLNDGESRETAFATIQKGIDTATDGNSVLVYPAVYDEALLINNKAIKLQGVATSAGIPIVQKASDYAVSYYVTEGPDSLLKNFVIRGSELGIFIVGGAPTISNVTIVDNVFGIAAYAAAAQPDISNCILWNNADGDLFGDPVPLEARYSCIEEGGEGEGNISIEPGFVDANSSDYHLRSQRGRHWPEHDVWVLDMVTSPCVDGGDPAVEPSNEPMPNGGRINMGAYGDTAYASMSEWPIEEDSNRDGIVNMKDMAKLASRWLEKLDWFE